MIGPRRHEAGYTFIEVAIVSSLILVGMLALSGLLGSARSIERTMRVDVLGERDLRNALLSIADVLRNVPESELSGFDANEASTRPNFRSIDGSNLGAPTLGPSAYLEWRAHSSGRTDDPGGIYLVEGTATTLLHGQVSAGSFVVRRSGAAIEIEVEVQRATGEGNAIERFAGQTVVALRNS